MIRVIAALLACLAVAPAGADAPRRIVSLNLCGDQFLLALADREQIASVSYMADDPALSFVADRAAAAPSNKGSGEAILMEGADLVLAGLYDGPLKRELLEARGVPVMVLPPWTDIASGRAQIRAVAARLGHPQRGEALIARIDDALARSKDIAPPRSILIIQRRGWGPGQDGFLGEILEHMNLRPMQAELGLPEGGVVRLERVVATPPDYALVNEAETGAIDNGAAFLAHPALAAAIPMERRLRLDGKLTICGGPSTPAAIDALAAQVRAKVR